MYNPKTIKIASLVAGAVVVPGLFSAIALPAYGAEVPTDAQTEAATRAHAMRVDSQSFTTLGTPIEAAAVQRDSFKATSVATLRHRNAVKAASVAHVSGASVASFLVNPPNPHFSLAGIVATAEKYQGVPYVFGGDSPAGFDCSGLVAYVYAQYGVPLPHSSAAQGAMGTRISTASAKPGDVVVMSGGSHVGIYLGGGRMIDAPEPGRVVSERAIYTSDYYIVRFGI